MGRIFPKSNRRISRFQKRQEQRQRLQDILHGEGEYVYRNHRNGSLMLPKPAKLMNGVVTKEVGPGQEFIGDSYFQGMVRNNEILNVRTIREANPQPQIEEKEIIVEKLILDQPERVTVSGQTEHVIVPINEKKNQPMKGCCGGHCHPKQISEHPLTQNQPGDVLLTEDPFDGVEICE